MGQSDILELLERKKIPMAAREIADEINERINEVITCLAKLLKHDEVKCFEIERKKAMKFFNSKRKLRIYYVDYNHFLRGKLILPYLK